MNEDSKDGQEKPESKETAINLSLIKTEDLITELTERHEEIIIIREDRKDFEWLNIRAKTGFGKYGNRDAGFDILRALNLLHTTAMQLLKDHLIAEKAEDSDSDKLPDADSSS